LSLLILVMGCVTSQNLYNVRVGMTKEEVVRTLGKPHSVAATGSTEILVYNLEREAMGGLGQYFVRIVNGRVDAFGERGDWDTTASPKERIELELKTGK